MGGGCGGVGLGFVAFASPGWRDWSPRLLMMRGISLEAMGGVVRVGDTGDPDRKRHLTTGRRRGSGGTHRSVPCPPRVPSSDESMVLMEGFSESGVRLFVSRGIHLAQEIAAGELHGGSLIMRKNCSLEDKAIHNIRMQEYHTFICLHRGMLFRFSLIHLHLKVLLDLEGTVLEDG